MDREQANEGRWLLLALVCIILGWAWAGLTAPEPLTCASCETDEQCAVLCDDGDHGDPRPVGEVFP